MRSDHRSGTAQRLPRELQARLSAGRVEVVVEFPTDAKAKGVREMPLPDDGVP
jgi:hypothetical protein